MDYPAHGLWFILLTLIIGLAVSIYPLPIWARWVRPDLILLLVIFWTLTIPQYVGVGWAWCTGLMLDLVQGAPLGQNAFALMVVAYFVQLSYQRLRMYSDLKQAGIVFVLVSFHVIFAQWVQNLQGISGNEMMLFLPAAIRAVMWPLVKEPLSFLQMRMMIV